MKLIIISGLSGSGKSIALNTLEDLDYYCIDNLPIGMLPSLVEQLINNWGKDSSMIAVGIDARNNHQDLEHFPDLLQSLTSTNLDMEIIYLEADDATLLKRFNETRRKHPLTNEERPLSDAIKLERGKLMIGE